MRYVLPFGICFFFAVGVFAQEPRNAVVAQRGMVVCVSPPAADIGVAILKQGGNAVDASVAVAFAMAVTHPAAGNIGGGGFMLVHPAKGKPVVIDYRETAPSSVTKETFVKTTDWYDHRAAGVPGTVRGLELAHQRFGRLPWKELVRPAVALAAKGFVLDQATAQSLNEYLKKSGGNAEFKRVFGKNEGKDPWRAGDTLIQPDLAKTLQRIAEDGPDAFYTGTTAEMLVAEMTRGKGYITAKDLRDYRALERTPIHGTYRGHDVYGAPPPSSGGIGLVEMLNMLEAFDLKNYGANSATTRHLLAEAMKRAYLDRAKHIGDPAFVNVPAFLTTKEYATRLAKQIDPTKATPSAKLAEPLALSTESDSTTHFSVIDQDGNAVANTYTLEDTYGSRVVVQGAGFILNNEMGDFNARPGVTTAKGRIGTDANLVAPQKRMLSSQAPTIIVKDGKVLLVTGSPGGRTIINTVLCVVTNVIDFDLPIQHAVDAPRQHHQWYPDELRLEGNDPDMVKKLEALGHVVKTVRKQGDAHSIWVDPKTGRFHGAADRRIAGKAAGY
jgi:gamma-glutamyltranspeptidase/glutathione hydrolase